MPEKSVQRYQLKVIAWMMGGNGGEVVLKWNRKHGLVWFCEEMSGNTEFILGVPFFFFFNFIEV